MTNPTVRDVIDTWLQLNKYDGLYNEREECGCFLTDLMPCDGAAHDCKAGYHGSERTCDGEYVDFVVAERPEPEKPVFNSSIKVIRGWRWTEVAGHACVTPCHADDNDPGAEAAAWETVRGIGEYNDNVADMWWPDPVDEEDVYHD